jgi:uncharacterized protein
MSQTTAPRRGSARSGSTKRASLPSTRPTLPVVSRRTLALVGIGLVAGFFSGVLGVGGGIVIIPLLVALVAYQAKPAMATSLAAILFTSVAAAASHAQAGNVDWSNAALIGLPATVGAVGGAWLHQRVAPRRVVLAFAFFLAVTAAKLAL